MKRIMGLLTLMLISASTFFALAVPPGVYYDKQGRMKALVTDNGKQVYSLAPSGEVRASYIIVEESSDGRFKLLLESVPDGIPNSDNNWWSENGTIYLNLACERQTLTRQ